MTPHARPTFCLLAALAMLASLTAGCPSNDAGDKTSTNGATSSAAKSPDANAAKKAAPPVKADDAPPGASAAKRPAVVILSVDKGMAVGMEELGPLPEEVDVEAVKKAVKPKLEGVKDKGEVIFAVDVKLSKADRDAYTKALVDLAREVGFKKIGVSQLKGRRPVVADKGIGQVQLGMTRDQVKATGLEVKPHPSGHFGDNVRVVGGDMHVVFSEEDEVTSVEVPLQSSGGLTYKDKLVPPGASFEQAQKIFEGCKADPPAAGGTTARCGGKILVKAGGPKAVISVQVIEAMPEK